MKGFIGNLRIDLRRAFLSFGFLLAVVGMSASLFFSSSTEGEMLAENYGDVLYLYRVAHVQGFSMLATIFAALPYATSFCVDWSNQFIRINVIRTDIRSYGISKVLANALAGGSAVALGEVLFILLLRLKLPLVNMQSPMFENAVSDSVFGVLLAEGHIISYFIVKVLISFCAAAFFAVLALAISTYITNIFVTLASPILSYYFLIQIFGVAGVSEWFNLQRILFGTVVKGHAFFSLCYSVIVIGILCVCMGIVIVHQIKRRLEHG